VYIGLYKRNEHDFCLCSGGNVVEVCVKFGTDILLNFAIVRDARVMNI